MKPELALLLVPLPTMMYAGTEGYGVFVTERLKTFLPVIVR